MNIKLITDRLKKSGSILAMQNAQEKNAALLQVAEALNQQKVSILKANLQDVSAARKKGISESLIDRLTLTEQRIDSIVESLKNVISQTDPIGEETAGKSSKIGQFRFFKFKYALMSGIMSIFVRFM